MPVTQPFKGNSESTQSFLDEASHPVANLGTSGTFWARVTIYQPDYTELINVNSPNGHGASCCILNKDVLFVFFHGDLVTQAHECKTNFCMWQNMNL